jgi:hypothetical protein
VGGSEAKNEHFFDGVFGLPSPRNAQKHDEQNRQKPVIFFRSAFELQCELQSLRNTRKRDKTRKTEDKTDIEVFDVFLGKVFDMGFLSKRFCAVFLLPLPRTAKRPKTY